MYIIIWNVMKMGEKQPTMLAQYSVLSAMLCVCGGGGCVYVCAMSDFWILYHFTRYINNRQLKLKVFVQNEIFFRLTGPNFWALCNQN